MTGRTPVRLLSQRAAEQGRIRTGKKSEKGFPQKLDAFRFTSSDQEAIEAIAAKYDSTAQVWAGAPGGKRQWETYTTAARIAVALPADCLGDGVTYELWAGGYCTRRCDGEVCDRPENGPDGVEMVPGPCICDTEPGRPQCKAKLRLNVVLTDIPFGGTWRLETSSEHAVRELPGMVDLILSLQEKTPLTGAVLVLDQRTKVKQVMVKGERKAQTQKFGVPMLAIPHSLDALVGGAAAIGTYGRSPAAALGSGGHPARQPDPSGGDMTSGPGAATLTASATPGPDDEDDVAEAEIVGEMTDAQIEALRDAADEVATKWNGDHPEDPLTAQALLQSAAAMISGNATQRISELDVAHGEKVAGWLAKVIGGEVLFKGIVAGRIKQGRPT